MRRMLLIKKKKSSFALHSFQLTAMTC